MTIETKTAIPAQNVPRLKDARQTSAFAAEVLKAHGDPDASVFEKWLPLLDQFIETLSK